MKEKDIKLTDNNIIEMDINKKEKHECYKCGEEAIFYNTEVEKWICENCKNIEDELDKLAAKMEKKLSKRVYSFDLKELIECLSKDEIYNIARNLGVAKISGLNKDKLAEKLIEEYKPLIEKRIGLFEEERYKILKSYIDNKGVKNFDDIDEEEADKSAYFIQQGIIYPTVKNDESMFLMPKVVQKIIKDKNDIDYRRILKGNTELINIYRGMNKAYGILKVEDAVKMLERFNTAIKEIEKENNIVIKNEDIDKIITIASMIEKEASEDIDRPLISSVIYNRLEKGMKLQLDATVLYALGEHVDVVLNRHLEVDSPYNTYKYSGLPIGPIASPGIECIKAALLPAKTDNLYYILQKDGTHYFTKSYEDFLAKKKELGY